jgi:hypothetical protein
MGISPGAAEDNSAEAASIEAEANRLAAGRETLANRPDQFGPTGSTTWESTNVDVDTGRPIHQDFRGIWQFSDVEINGSNGVPIDPMQQTGIQPNGLETGMFNKDPSKKWTQTTTLTPEWQATLDQGQDLLEGEMGYRTRQQNNWEANPFDTSGIGGSNLQSTIGRGDLGQFGQQSGSLGADDWRQFGTTQQTTGANDYQQFGTTNPTISADQWQNIGMASPTLGADDWRQFGTTEQTIGANDYEKFGVSNPQISGDDWRQFGNTERTLTGDTYDERYAEANADPTGGYGAHGMEGSDWDQIQYAPEAIRRQAEQQTLDFMNSQLDPQWDTRQADLEQQLTNQGLQWGDAAWDSAMESQKNSRDQAYGGARNQALADSRAEASMLWGQEMQRSEQKNMQTQSDLDNIYRARQSNIGNYQQGQGQEQANYLAYQNSAFDQDRAARQQQLDANLNYGREGFQQDFNSRQQQLDADLGYGREAFGQDLQSRQQQLDANRMYGNDAFSQDLQSKQQGLDAQLSYGSEAWNQDFQGRQQQLNADLDYGRQAYQQDYDTRQQNVNNNLSYNSEAYNQDYQSRQANISNYLNYGNAEFGQNATAQQLDLQARQAAEDAAQGRYGLVNPNQTAGTLNTILNG